MRGQRRRGNGRGITKEGENMQRHQGIHFYINITNFNQILLTEEAQTKRVNHAIHALDTFFSSIEAYGKKLYPKTFVVEKITGARLHLYVTDDITKAFQVVKTVSAYAFRLCSFLNTEIAKYKSLDDFHINVGSAYGRFYDFEFTTKDGFSESTTIGHAANYAAKLQARAEVSKIAVSEDIFESMSLSEQAIYQKVYDSAIKEYGHECYYTTHLNKIVSPVIIKFDDLEDVKKRANSVNLTDIDYSGVRKPLNFRDLSTTQCKELEGIPVFADVRDFTSQFAEDDSNLNEMTQKTQSILEKMYQVSSGHGGIHVQFQGDRELSLYHNVPGGIVEGTYIAAVSCYKAAVLAAMRLVDAVKPYSVHIGVGEDFGRLFATRIGARGEKDNILLGETVIHADYMEDVKAGKDQVAITAEVYSGLRSEDAVLARQFKQADDGTFLATIGFAEYKRNLEFAQQQKNTTTGNYNKAWGDLL